jgi:GTPase SAR1 family protein
VITTIQCWDIGGDAMFTRMLKNYLFAANAVLFVYDISNHATFRDLEEWLKIVQKTFIHKLPRLAVIGNKGM